MVDLPNVEKDRFVIEGADGTDVNVILVPSGKNALVVTSFGIVDLAAAGKVFVATNEKILTGTSVPWILFRNPVGSGKTVQVLRVLLSLDEPQAKRIEVEFFEKPTVTTAGTLVTARNRLIGSTATASGEFRTDPTVSANGNLINEFDFTANIPLSLNLNGEAQIQANNDILIRARAPNGNTTARINFVWGEV